MRGFKLGGHSSDASSVVCWCQAWTCQCPWFSLWNREPGRGCSPLHFSLWCFSRQRHNSRVSSFRGFSANALGLLLCLTVFKTLQSLHFIQLPMYTRRDFLCPDLAFWGGQPHGIAVSCNTCW